MRGRLVALGWPQIVTIDDDLGLRLVALDLIAWSRRFARKVGAMAAREARASPAAVGTGSSSLKCVASSILGNQPETAGH